MSLRPEWAEALYTHEKRYEFRRRRFDADPGDVVVIYETRPVSLVTGQFRIGAVHYGTPAELQRLESDRTRARSVAAYLKGARQGTALEVSEVERYPTPRSLAALGIEKPPMSYRRL
jgi:predicted transcriptional regulator